MDYRHGSHTRYEIEYHLVRVTKYRYQVLTGEIGLREHELVRQTCERLEIEIIRGVVSNDHVHLLISPPPALLPSYIMRRIKGCSSSKLLSEFKHLDKRYWRQHFWAEAIFVLRKVSLTKEMINGYLEHYFERRSDDEFEVEW